MTAKSKEVVLVSVRLIQERKNSSKTIINVEYSFKGKVELDVEKLSKSVSLVIFRKLALQRKSNINFGIQVSRPFRVVIDINSKNMLDTDKNAMLYTDNAKLKIKNKLLSENETEARKSFENDFFVLAEEASIAHDNFRGCFEKVS